MKPDTSFDNARPVARHCAELFRADAVPGAEGDGFAQFGADLARALVPGLGALLGAAKLRVTSSNAAVRDLAEFAAETGSPCAAATIAFPDAGAEIASIVDAKTLIALTDRLFGGEGDDAADDGELPEEMPLMADLVASQIQTALGEALERTLPALGTGEAAGRAPGVDRLDLFARDETCVVLELTVAQPERADWVLRLAVREAGQARFAVRRAKSSDKALPRPLDPATSTLGDMPFEMVAVVAETHMPLSRVSALKPGDIVPLAIARQVPLRIGERTLAHGSVGSVDDRVALRVRALS